MGCPSLFFFSSRRRHTRCGRDWSSDVCSSHLERWHLPHWMEDVDVRFDRQGKAVTARVEVDGSPVADLTITDYSWNPVSHLYQAFMKDDRGAYLASITMEGQQSEHEEETGRIQLHEHPFNKDLVISEIYEQPFREMW